MSGRQDWATLLELIAETGSLDDSGIQGLMYLLKDGFGLPLSYVFKMRLSGPFSVQLLEDVQRLAAWKLLTRKQGRYSIGDDPEGPRVRDHLSGDSREAIKRLNGLLAELPSDRTAVLPTMLLAFRESQDMTPIRPEEVIVDFVSSMRPAVSREELTAAFSALPGLFAEA